MSKQELQIEKIDVEELINDFKVFNADAFQTYLKGVWKDLANRSDNKYKGINKITLSKYYELPGIIFDRLFSVLDSNKTEYVNLDEFINGMMTLFTKSFDDLVKLIFNFYDFDKDGKICKEDVRIVLSYVPLNKSKITTKSNYNSDYKNRIESQDELHKKLDLIFQKNDSINEQEFIKIVENVNSDIFLYILIFLLEKRPFNNQTIKILENIKKSPSILNMPKSPGGKLIASPTLNSIFEPSITINKSPSMNKSPKIDSENTLQKQIDRNQNQSDLLLKLAGQGGIKPKPKAAAPSFKPNVNMKKKEEYHTGPTPMRKIRHKLQELDEKIIEQKYEGDDEIPLQFARKFDTKKENIQMNDDKSISSDDDKDDIKDQQIESEENQKGNYSGYIYKITHKKKLKKIFFRLIYKDFYYYKSAEDELHKGMHNLSGVFVKEEPECVIENKHLFSFSIINPMKTRKYYVEDEKEFKEWLNNLRKSVGFSDLNDIYEIKGKLGKGKFGLVRLGINKLTKEKVAIKIMKKNNMSISDLEQVKTEIEIMKVANHPNIIRLYDEYENMDYIYISKIIIVYFLH